MITKLALELATLCSKEESRYTLNGIRVEPGRVCETDGHQMVVYDFIPESAESFPEVDGAKAVGTFKPFTLGKDAALQVAKALPKKSTIPVLQQAAIVGDPDKNGEVKFMVTDLERHQGFTAKKLEGQFPDYNRVIPKAEDAKLSIGVNAELLRGVLGYLSKVADSSGRCPGVLMHFYDEQSAIRIDAKSDQGHAIGVVMPMRVDGAKSAKAEARPDLDVPAYIQGFLDSTNKLLADASLSTDQGLAVQKIFEGINNLSKTLSAPEPGPGIPVELGVAA